MFKFNSKVKIISDDFYSGSVGVVLRRQVNTIFGEKTNTQETSYIIILDIDSQFKNEQLIQTFREDELELLKYR